MHLCGLKNSLFAFHCTSSDSEKEIWELQYCWWKITIQVIESKDCVRLRKQLNICFIV